MRIDEAWRQELVQRLAGIEPRALERPGLRRAAVTLVLLEAGHGAEVPGLPRLEPWSEAPALLLTRRALTLREHAGQWALPGGRIDAGESPEQAALRELHEETGLALPTGAVLGRLDDYATRSGYVITPVLAWGGAVRQLAPNRSEVASLHRLPVQELLRADAPILDPMPGGAHPVLRMPVGSHWIAAPTAAFLYQFREWCLHGRQTRVVDFDQPRFAWR